MRPCVFILTDSLATTLNFTSYIYIHAWWLKATSQGEPVDAKSYPSRGARWKGKKAPNSVHLEGSNRGGSGAEPDALSVLCFVPCFYLHRIIYFPYIPRTNARYKAVRGAADISTQAGSLETFELLARRAGEVVWGWWRRLSPGWFRAAREKRGVASGIGTETGVPPREGSRAETDKINNE